MLTNYLIEVTEDHESREKSTRTTNQFCIKFYYISYELDELMFSISTFDNLLKGNSMLLCICVMMPVATVMCPSRIVNGWPLFITIFLKIVKRTFECSPGINMSFPPTEIYDKISISEIIQLNSLEILT